MTCAPFALEICAEGKSRTTLMPSRLAVSLAAILPLIVIRIFLERFIVKGLTAGAVK